MHAVRMPVPDFPGLALLLTVALLALVLALDVPSLSAQTLFSGIPFGDPGLLGLAMTGGVGAAGGVFYLSASSAVHHGGEGGDLKTTIAMWLRGEGPAVIKIRDTACGPYHLMGFQQVGESLAVVFGPKAVETDFADPPRSEIWDCLVDLVKIARLRA